MKKHLLLAAFALLLSSCSAVHQYTTIYYNDYSTFKQNQIYVTELSSVNFTYEALGNITVSMIDGTIKKSTDTSSNRGDDLYTGNQSKWQWAEATTEQIYQKVCDIIKEKGGNGIVNMKYTFLPKDKQTKQGGIIVTGMVIKK